MAALSLTSQERILYALALLVRVAFIAFGEWQDRSLPIPYTDVDYEVISDAAQLIVDGDSPFGRATYRYSPLLAYLLLPNVFVHRCWGKMLFSFADLIVGKSLQAILARNGISPGKSLRLACLWLFCPLSINITTRGSFDALTSALLLGSTSALLGGSLCWSAIAFGVVVHLRVYPIIYAPAFALHLAGSSLRTLPSSVGGTSTGFKGFQVWRALLSRRPLLFAVVSATTFFLCTAVCVHAYGLEFVRNALLYHLTRTDNRHNYSIYWYWIYLDYLAPHRWFLGLVAFLPQGVMLMAIASLLHGDLALCIFVQTSVFVFFNKVFTGQYITWYVSLLPLLLPHLSFGWKKGSAVVASWLGSLTLWLFVAWELEMQGRNVYFALWISSMIMFATNVYALNGCIRTYCNQGRLVSGG